MQTNPAVEQSKIITPSKSPWNQSGSASMTVKAVGTAVRTQIYLLTYLLTYIGVLNWTAVFYK